jgi:uncharacterized protein DUF3224
MMTKTQAHSTFQVKNWDEQTTSEVDGHLKITSANVVFGYSGDVQGDSAMHYLMLYRDDGTAAVIGMERITGRLAGRSGSFALQHRGGYADGTASGEFEVVEGSASGELAGLRGHGRAIARKDGSTEFTLDYELPAQ